MRPVLMPGTDCSKSTSTDSYQIHPFHSCRGLNLGQSLALFETSLLLEAHNLEAVEVGQVLPPLDLVSLLRPVALLPLGVDLVLFPELLDSAISGAADETLYLELGQ